MSYFMDTFAYDRRPQGLVDRLTNHTLLEDDFQRINSGDWTLTGSGGAVAMSTVSGYQDGGWIALTTDGTNNHEAYLTTGAFVKCATGRGLYFGCRMACVEAAVNTSNLVFGLIDAAHAATMINDGGGPIVNADKMLLYKNDGTMQWNAVTAKATGTGTNVQTSSNILAYASSTIYELGIAYQPPKTGQVTSTVHYFINGVEVATHPVTSGTATSTVTAQPTAELTPVLGVKTGDPGNAAQAVLVDWLVVAHRR